MVEVESIVTETLVVSVESVESVFVDGVVEHEAKANTTNKMNNFFMIFFFIITLFLCITQRSPVCLSIRGLIFHHILIDGEAYLRGEGEIRTPVPIY